MNAYLDSSVILRLILGEAGRLQGWEEFGRLVASDLAEVECLRTLDRLRLQGAFGGEALALRREALFRFLDGMERVELGHSILGRASEPFPVALGTLDAIHLATALAWREDQDAEIIMATHDKALALASKACRLRVEGV